VSEVTPDGKVVVMAWTMVVDAVVGAAVGADVAFVELDLRCSSPVFI